MTTEASCIGEEKIGLKPNEDSPQRVDAPVELAPAVFTVCVRQDNNLENTRYREIEEDKVTARRRRRREKEAIRKRVYHQRLKDERNSLRKTVDELSHQLEKLQQGKDFTSLKLFGSVWRDLAEEERQKLLNSEAEQKQLLAVAKAKASCIKELCEQIPILMDQCAATKSSEKSDVVQSPTSPPFDYTMFRGHLRRVHESYAQVDEIFNSNPMPEGFTISVKRNESNDEIEFCEYLHKLREPFRYERTHQTLWKLFNLQHRQQDRDDFGDVVGSDDLIVVRFRLCQTLTSRATVSVLQRLVAQRFVEEFRTVFVWKIHSEGEGIFQGMHSDETGWFCINPDTEEDTTEIRACVRQVPVRFGISTWDDLPSEEFHQILQDATNEDMLHVTSKLDQLLLEDSLSGINM
ncbi:hypothetical protein PHMEG_00025252 [Phytophthora megakarya]|uniref:Uncharacterized protein n=1 Tax=Phytophthora megakarya TaxID=4795 RepID=A0A225VCL1_9STRA|nr:hypothetical protein PHMEG_00025252 [Phytophthora megakarya]